jgi:hypothetical protein
MNEANMLMITNTLLLHMNTPTASTDYHLMRAWMLAELVDFRRQETTIDG